MNIDRFELPNIKDEPKVIKVCANCGEPIYEGEHHYNINGVIYCNNCVEINGEIAEED